MGRLRALAARAARAPVAARDGLLAAVLCAVDLRTQWTVEAADRLVGEGPVPWPLVVGYAVAGYAALAWRRHRPGTVFVVVLVHSLVAQVFLPWRPLLGLLVAFYTVAVRMSLPRSLAALLGVSVASALTVADEVSDSPPGERVDVLLVNVILYLVLELALWGVARIVHRGGRELRASEARRRAAARVAVAEERARIARELHDIVAHAVTVIVLQAAGARQVLPAGLPQVERSLTNIETTGRQAMDELRRLLGVLADAGLRPGEGAKELEPHPGIEDLGPVVARVAAAGLPVRVDHHGTARPLDTSVGVAAYRVVSEGLTNALKHGGAGARTVVRLEWKDEELVVSVTDDGWGRPPEDATPLSGGHGLAGLDERVRAVGGRLRAGPLADGGYQVSATLPASARDR
ncbi:Sensor histidine kinase DesK [Nonomuraea coxensis DSM 45129]|uniref:histidine kinase n=1 Tax=Nonomuraea coxensis DSM 45129 TaxID=1122611 RepID=A0ABX8TT39_9ACTN|nr:histidine kinase [Nonomuraea coxensis]QYC38396.1 Sensor histidine kinase DesK [Nonomuraea coxensis DSM 45129]